MTVDICAAPVKVGVKGTLLSQNLPAQLGTENVPGLGWGCNANGIGINHTSGTPLLLGHLQGGSPLPKRSFWVILSQSPSKFALHNRVVAAAEREPWLRREA
jgi:hypothetical protein